MASRGLAVLPRRDQQADLDRPQQAREHGRQRAVARLVDRTTQQLEPAAGPPGASIRASASTAAAASSSGASPDPRAAASARAIVAAASGSASVHLRPAERQPGRRALRHLVPAALRRPARSASSASSMPASRRPSTTCSSARLPRPPSSRYGCSAAARQRDRRAQVPRGGARIARPDLGRPEQQQGERPPLRRVGGAGAGLQQLRRHLDGAGQVAAQPRALERHEGEQARPARHPAAAPDRRPGQLQVAVARSELAELEVDRGQGDRDRRLTLRELRRQVAQHGAQGGAATDEERVQPAVGGEARRERPGTAGDRVAHGVDRPAVGGQPSCRPHVGGRLLLRRQAGEPAAQQLEEQPVVAPPLAPGVEGHDEAVPPLELAEQLGSAAPPMTASARPEHSSSTVAVRTSRSWSSDGSRSSSSVSMNSDSARPSAANSTIAWRGSGASRSLSDASTSAAAHPSVRPTSAATSAAAAAARARPAAAGPRRS